MLSPLLWQKTPFGNSDAWSAFLSEHAQQHTRLYNTLIQAGRYTYSAYPLADGGTSAWLWANYSEHQAIAARLAVEQPPDLASYDLSDPTQFTDWMDFHARDHVRLNNAAGLV